MAASSRTLRDAGSRTKAAVLRGLGFGDARLLKLRGIERCMPLCLDSSIRLSLSVCIFVVAFLAVTMMSTRIARERALDSGLRVE